MERWVGDFKGYCKWSKYHTKIHRIRKVPLLLSFIYSMCIFLFRLADFDLLLTDCIAQTKTVLFIPLYLRDFTIITCDTLV